MPRDSKDPVWRKKKARGSKEPPFPVPIASISADLPSHQTWYCYTGLLKGSTVVVQYSGDVEFLYRMGFFGKGSLSRSEPNFEARRRKVNIPNPNKDKPRDEENQRPPVDTIQLTVVSKRNYLKHLQYRALAEDDEAKYNELIEQESMQRFRNGEEDDEFEAEDNEEEGEEEEESYESGSSSPVKLTSDAEHDSDRGSGQSGLSLDLGSQSRSFLLSLLSQVAELSKENIATFVRVPQTLHQLEIKFQKKRLEQDSQLDYRDASDHPSDTSPSKSISKSWSQDVIDLRDLDETDDVVVLNSDENSKDSERHNGGENGKRAGKTSKSWDDPGNKGDPKFWGIDTNGDSEKSQSEGSVKANEKTQNEGSVIDGEKSQSEGSVKANEKTQNKGSVVDGEKVQSEGSVRDGEKVQSEGNVRDGEKVQSEGNVRDREKVQSEGSVRDIEKAQSEESARDSEKAHSEGSVMDSVKDQSEVSVRDSEGVQSEGIVIDSEKAQREGSVRDCEKAHIEGSVKDNEKVQSEGSIMQNLTIESSIPEPAVQSVSSKNSSSSLNSESFSRKAPESLRNGAKTDGENIDNETSDQVIVPANNGDERNNTGISDDLQTHVSAIEKGLEDCQMPDTQSADKSGGTKRDRHDAQSLSGKMTSGKTGNLVSVDPAELEEATSVPEGDVNSFQSPTNPKTTSFISPSNEEDSNDSDDVICVEAGSAEPSKLHSFLSQYSPQVQTSTFPLTSKMVRFMTNIAKEARFITAKVGFQSWTNILHFNFSGDTIHLPTAVEVLQEEDETNPHSFPSGTSKNTVYERIYPPVGSLLADPESKGVVIRQRLEGIPFLDIARRNVLSSLSNASHQSRSDNRHVPSIHNASRHHTQLHHKLSHPPSTPPHQRFNLLEKENEESSSLEPSHVTQYVSVFQRQRSDRTLDTVCVMNSSSDTKIDKGDECLDLIHRELHELKVFSLISNQTTTEKEEVTDKDTKLLKFNRLVSGYLSKIGISLIKEFVLLKMLVCGSETNDKISKDFVVAAKSKLSPEEYSSLLERMDFVQSCLASYNSLQSVVETSEKKESPEDVIMIDLSDEESNDKNESDHFVGDASTLSSQAELQNVSKSKSNRDGCKDSSEGSADNEDKEMVPENFGNWAGRKRSRQDSPESEHRMDAKIAKVSFLHSENSTAERDSSVTLNGSQAINKSLISSNHQKADEDDSISLEKSGKNENAANNDSGYLGKCEKSENVDDNDSASLGRCEKNEKADSSDSASLGKCEKNEKRDGNDFASLEKCERKDTGDSHFKDKKSGSNCVTQKDVSDYSEMKREISDKGINSVETNGRIKPDSNIGASPESVDKSASQNVQKSSKDNASPSTSHVTAEENQIYIESSDEEEERLSSVKAKPSELLGSRPHPYSMTDDVKGNLFVVPNTSDEEEEEEEALSSSAGRFTWQSCVKKDPYPTSEQLHLLLEEAFFLTFGLGCLSVLDPEKKPMTITEMWQQFPLLKDNFVPHYVAYHYFRSKGWVPKSGLKFGCDFVLYRQGPPFFHGSYSVVVVAVHEGTLTPMIGDDGGLDYAQRLNSWITLSGLNRVTEHVAKELMYCYVICPKNLTEEESKSPKCLSRFRVKEIIVSRWVSSKEREAKDKEEIP